MAVAGPVRRAAPAPAPTTPQTPRGMAPVASRSSGLAARAAKAQVYGAGNYFQDGKHVVVIKRVLERASDRGNGKCYFIIECEMVESNNPKCRPGDLVTQVIDVTQDAGPGNVKGFCMAIGSHLFEEYNPADYSDEQFLAQVIDSFVLEEQAAAGVTVEVVAATIRTRKGTDFTKVSWQLAEVL